MRITDQYHRSTEARKLRFPVASDSEDILCPGALVCLQDDRGNLLAARQAGDRGWGMCTLSLADGAQTLPADALFLVVRRGNQAGFVSLGYVFLS